MTVPLNARQLGRRHLAVAPIRTERLSRIAGSDPMLGVLVALISLVVYDRTLTPSLSYLSPDGNELATIAATLGLAHATGYPLYTWLGNAFTYIPIGDVAHRVNLFSAVGAAGAAGLTVLILRELKVPKPIAVAGGLLFAFSPTLWSQATISEVYAPNILFVALEVYLLLLWGRHQKRPSGSPQGDLQSTVLLAAWALTYSLSLGLHLSGLGFAPAFVIYILSVNYKVLVQPFVLVPAVTVFLLGILQFLWIPLRYAAGKPAPDPLNPLTVDGFLSYTVNAFPDFKWAFPLEMMPDRFIVYTGFVLDNFGWPGVALGACGALALAISRPRTFLMLVSMWSVHVIFFMGYRAQDIDVFFIPAHFLLLLAVSFGLASAWRAACHLAARLGTPGLIPVAAAGGLLLLVAAVGFQLERSYASSDRSDHTEINDFYLNVFARLPEGASLVGASGVFGYDMFYYPLVYDVRPDVAIPLSRTSSASDPGASNAGGTFSVSPEGQGSRVQTGSSAGEAWWVPVIAAPSHTDPMAFIRRDLILYQESRTAPALIADSEPRIPLQLEGESFALVGADISGLRVTAGETINVRLYWEVLDSGSSTFALRVGDEGQPQLLQDPGFGLAERYDREVAPLAGKTIVDEFEFVVLSSTPRGDQDLVLTVDGNSVVITTLEVF